MSLASHAVRWLGVLYRGVLQHMKLLEAMRSRGARLSASASGAALEPLEPRQLLSTVTWANASGGYWDVAANWTGNAVPGAGDDVVIDVATSPTITIRSNVSANSLVCREALSLSGGSLTLAAASEVDDAFTLSSSTLTTNGPLSLNGSSQWSGGTINGAGVPALREEDDDVGEGGGVGRRRPCQGRRA